jgi:hypothetical protein
MIVGNRGERRRDKGREKKKCRRENDTPQMIIYKQMKEDKK